MKTTAPTNQVFSEFMKAHGKDMSVKHSLCTGGNCYIYFQWIDQETVIVSCLEYKTAKRRINYEMINGKLSRCFTFHGSMFFLNEFTN